MFWSFPIHDGTRGIYGLINVEIVSNKATDAILVQNLIFASVLIFFHENLSCH